MLKNVASRLPFSLNLCKKIIHYVKDVFLNSILSECQVNLGFGVLFLGFFPLFSHETYVVSLKRTAFLRQV